LANGAPAGTVTLPSPDGTTNLDSGLPMSYVHGSLVVPTHDSGPWPFTILFAFPAGTGGRQPKAEGIRFEGEIRAVPTAPITAPALPDGHLVMAGAFPAGVYDIPPAGPPQTLLKSSGFVVSAVPAGDLVLAQENTTLEAIPRAGGPPAWTFTMGQPSPTVQPAVVGRTVVVPLVGKGLVGLDLQSGRVKWSTRFTGSVGLSSPLPLPGGKVAYAVGGLTVLDAATGTVQWHQPGINAVGRIAFDNGTIFAEALTGQAVALLAVDAASGKLRWLHPFNAPVGLGPSAGHGVVVATDTANVLTVFGQSDGSKLWSVPLRTSPNGEPAVVGDRVVVQEQGRSENVNQRDYRLSAFDAHTGQLEAQWELPGSGFTHAGFGASGDILVAPGITTQAAIFLLRMVGA